MSYKSMGVTVRVQPSGCCCYAAADTLKVHQDTKRYIAAKGKQVDKPPK